MSDQEYLSVLTRIADALERQSPAKVPNNDLSLADAYVWSPETGYLDPVLQVSCVPLDMLEGIDLQKEILLKNTQQFAGGFSANNALLWGARGTGKSSIVKAIHAKLNEDKAHSLMLVEIHREDLETLPALLKVLKTTDRRCVLYCDDLSFDGGDTSYKSLKAVLEGGIEGRPENVIFYATSNRRHLMPRDMIENERSTAIHASEAVEEKVSLSDRFGLWLGFHNMDQETYFAAIRGYIANYSLKIEEETWKAEAIEWTVTRGGRSGRVAWQYIQDLAGRLGQKLT
ncbi:ATP-binding protein [Terasakiella sp. A23]|uniref:ATP-binding protein n=1 Tax=Terasakiella sp. FCG-A23 TaxID=3080561 RepID=UPI0029543B16|nr:ATP-binding protein [Terasakiella sp. A23]MDV7338775.1 ATP-binding protein [Terasakiella sp. A23]